MDSVVNAINSVINEGITKSNGFQKKMGRRCRIVFTWLTVLTVFQGALFWWVLEKIGYALVLG